MFVPMLSQLWLVTGNLVQMVGIEEEIRCAAVFGTRLWYAKHVYLVVSDNLRSLRDMYGSNAVCR